MLAIRERAAVPTTAPKHNRHNESYRSSVSTSIAKLQIGEFLLTLQAPLSQNQRKEKIQTDYAVSDPWTGLHKY